MRWIRKRVNHSRIKLHIVAGLARGRMGVVHGIVVHQTGGATAAAAFAGYKARPYGTHFLIDKDGSIYQNASLLYYTAHIEDKGSLPRRASLHTGRDEALWGL